MADQTTKARGLYQLYRDEKKHEDRTRRMLTDLERNNEQLFDAKLKLVEMLLDVQVKDELARQSEADETTLPQLNAELIRENARKRMQVEVQAHAGESQVVFDGGFMSQLSKLAKQDETEARREVHDTVSKYVDPHMEKLRRERRRRPDGPLESVARAANEVAARRKAEMQREQHMRARVDHSDRARRVDSALSQLKRDIGDLTPLLHVEPREYKTDIGKREAEENDLRQLIARQRAEEERLLQERQVNKAVIELEQSKLAAEVDTVCQQLVLLQRELETKEFDLKEMAAAQVPGSGSWATSTMQLEKDLALAVEEEYHLKHDTTEVAHKNDLLNTERAALEAEVADSIDELARMQKEQQEVLDQIDQKLTAAKQRMYRLRDDEIDMTNKVNDYMYRILHRREDVRQQKRDLRSTVNTIISQISVEDRLQSALTARALELQTQAEKARGQMEHDIATLQSQLQRVMQELKSKSALISQNVELLTNLKAAKLDRDKDAQLDMKLTAMQLNTQIEQLTKEWSRVEFEAASSVAQVAARVDHAKRENDRVLRQIGRFVIMQEDIAAEGVDLAKTTTAELHQVQESLYSEASQRAYREAKYTQCTRLLRDRLQLRARGDRSIVPLTTHKHVSLRDRRARREAAARSRQARDLALQHVRNFNAADSTLDGSSMAGSRGPGVHIRDYFSGSSPAGERSLSTVTGRSGPTGAEVAAREHPEFRRLVIDFVKKEIQPLYDTSQITKKRFVDVVSRVSTWFLDTHRPSTELSEQHLNELTKAIQEVLTWQDEQRLGTRAS